MNTLTIESSFIGNQRDTTTYCHRRSENW